MAVFRMSDEVLKQRMAWMDDYAGGDLNKAQVAAKYDVGVGQVTATINYAKERGLISGSKVKGAAGVEMDTAVREKLIQGTMGPPPKKPAAQPSKMKRPTPPQVALSPLPPGNLFADPQIEQRFKRMLIQDAARDAASKLATTGQTVQYNLRIDTGILEVLKDAAAREGVKPSEMMRRLLCWALEQYVG